MSAIVELTDTHVVHKARSGGLFTRDRVYALTGTDLAVAPGETVGVMGATSTHPAAAPRTTEAVA